MGVLVRALPYLAGLLMVSLLVLPAVPQDDAAGNGADAAKDALAAGVEADIPGLTGEWYAQSHDGFGNMVEIQAVINGVEWSATSAKTIADAFGRPVTYQSAQGGTLEVFPPSTIRFAVFWQQPSEINARGIDLPPGITYTIEKFGKDRLLLSDNGCAEVLPKPRCVLEYHRVR